MMMAGHAPDEAEPWDNIPDAIADRCPECGSDNVCEQSREDDPPFACLDCAAEFEAFV